MIPSRDTIHPPVATWLLILANCGVFLFELMLPPPFREEMSAASTPSLRRGGPRS
jgi:hypothetical protein